MKGIKEVPYGNTNKGQLTSKQNSDSLEQINSSNHQEVKYQWQAKSKGEHPLINPANRYESQFKLNPRKDQEQRSRNPN